MALKVEMLNLSPDDAAVVPAVRLTPLRGVSGKGVSGGEIADVAKALYLAGEGGTIAVIGGANDFDTVEFDAIRTQVAGLLSKVAEVAASLNLVVIDGGTAHGVMRLMGEARAGQGSQFPLIGVLPEGKVTWANRPAGEGGHTFVDPHHSAFVLVETDTWGGESGTLAALAHTLAGDWPRLEILVNGGDVTLRDVQAYLERDSRGRVLVIQGSGRLADRIAAAIESGSSDDPDIIALLGTGRLDVFALDAPPETLASLLLDVFGS